MWESFSFNRPRMQGLKMALTLDSPHNDREENEILISPVAYNMHSQRSLGGLMLILLCTICMLLYTAFRCTILHITPTLSTIRYCPVNRPNSMNGLKYCRAAWRRKLQLIDLGPIRLHWLYAFVVCDG